VAPPHRLPNEAELLLVLDRPDIPLHTCQVIKRWISCGTKTDTRRDCRDAFLGLAKTCRKPQHRLLDYLGARLRVPGAIAVPQSSAGETKPA
jgi:hypothetical protein